MNPSIKTVKSTRRHIPAILALALALAPALQAVVFQWGDVKGSFDTTISVGGLYRINNPDAAYYSITSSVEGVAGKQRSSNADDGNLNYKGGVLASFLVKASHDLQLDYGKKMGAFVRGFYFNDFINSNGTRARTPLSPEAEKIVAQNGELLDAYVYFKPSLGDMPASIRIGRQVLSWGESTFIPNGINSINPIDVGKLRTPGSEIKEALRPLNMVAASLNLTQELTLEAFYLLDWDRTRVDPPGTYFSGNDFVAKGGKKVYLGFGAIADSSALGAITRGTDREPGNSGQWGINFKWLAHGLNDTEFGLYYMNYHSRLPVISAQTPTDPVSVTLVVNTASALANANIAPAMIGAGIPAGTVAVVLPGLVQSALGGVPVGSLAPSLAPYAAFYPAAQSVASGARTIGFLTAAGTGRYLIEFPENLHLFGASFNTSIHGIALQGEVSYRDNQPLQIDDVELLFAALSSLNPAFGPNNQIGNFLNQLNTYVPGYHRHTVWTGQMTATKVTRGFFGAAQTTLLAEAGFVNVTDLPAKSTLRYDGPGTFVGGDLTAMTLTGNGASGSDPASAFADKFSWGYQVLARLDYTNAFKGVNMSPLIVFTHDVSGNTPLPLGNFLHGRKSLTVGSEFTFQNAWAVDIRYVNFLGAGRFNLLGDRDYLSFNVKYSF